MKNKTIDVEIREEVKEGSFKSPNGGYRKIKIMGWIVGCNYPHDGGEWLFFGSSLCSLDNSRPDSNPTLYKNKEEALIFAQTLTSSWPLFIRPYICENYSKNP